MADTLAAIYHNLSVMLDGGVPILRAVRSAGLNLKGPAPRAFVAVADAMRRGEDMAETMRRFPGVFQELDIMAVEVGDMSGRKAEDRGRRSRISNPGAPGQQGIANNEGKS